MPIYEYSCKNCGAGLEAMQRVSDPHLKDCLACGQPSLVRLVSAAGFRLQGAGWYETDFKKDTDKKRNLADAKITETSTQESVSSAGSTSSSNASSSANSHSSAASTAGAAASPSTSNLATKTTATSTHSKSENNTSKV